MAKILITGGAGFIGSHLGEQYLLQGDNIVVLDNLSTGSIENVEYLQSLAPERVKFIQGSILDKPQLEALIMKADIVIHLAAAVGVNYILDNPLSSILTNVQGTEFVLELCDKYSKKVLIASTSEVYGKQKGAPLSEDQDCVYGSSDKLRWSYAGGKLMDEFLSLAYHRERNLPVVVCRFFNTVGPRQTGTYGMVIPRLVAQALCNEPMTVFGDGKQTRTFTHVSEVVASLLSLMDCEKAQGQVVNIGGVEEISILQVAELIKEKTNSSSTIQLIPYKEAYSSDFEDMKRRVPSTDKLRSLIGFAPTIGAEQIIEDVVNFHREVLEQGRDLKAVNTNM